MPEIRIPEDLVIGRVLHEDEAFMTIELVKDETRELTLNPNPDKPDRFFTLVFLKVEDDAEKTVVTWKPWRDA